VVEDPQNSAAYIKAWTTGEEWESLGRRIASDTDEVRVLIKVDVDGDVGVPSEIWTGTVSGLRERYPTGRNDQLNPVPVLGSTITTTFSFQKNDGINWIDIQDPR
jgi:hypothetical protein